METQDNYQVFTESMKELASLTETAQGDVVGELIQKLPTVNKKTIIGKGKLEELTQLILAREADMVIFNHELTARQTAFIEEAVQVKVIDRVQLILDIFALRARSKEGQLQVELAQLSYLLPRLTGQGISMSRLGGGIGTRGPGETKLETDRRHIRNKMSQIKKELKELSAHRERIRQKRQESEVFQIGLIGYTNAGKSTIMNAVTKADTYEQDQLFATLDPLTKKWTLPSGMQMTLTDTVGFIQDLPTQLIEAFQSTLEESHDMDLLLHVVDSSSSDRLQQEQTVMHLLHDLKMDKTPVLTVYNKSDLCSKEVFVPTLFPNCLISARKEQDINLLKDAIIREMKLVLVPYHIELSENQAYLLSELNLKTLVINWKYDEKSHIYIVDGYAKKGSKWLSYK